MLRESCNGLGCLVRRQGIARHIPFDEKDEGMKQVIVMRRDLKMRRGKECAQAGHAALKWLADLLNPSVDDLAGRFLTEEQAEWLYGTQKKVVVYVNSEQELLDLHAKAKDTGLESHLIQDLGLTEFGGNPTYTCLAIGPNSDTQIDQVTSGLPLY